MSVTTYRIQAQKIQTTYYRGTPNQSATFTLVHIAQLVSEEMASFAFDNAVMNSKAGETFYSNDTFIATFPNITIQFDNVLNQKYVPLPSIPTALPSNQEIQKVWPVNPIGQSARKVQIVVMSNRSKFSQDMLPPVRGMVLSYIENGNLVFDNTTAFNFSAVNMNLIGAMPNGVLLDQTLLLPKNYESQLSTKVIERLMQTAARGRDEINDEKEQPS
jgi:hypothetical protein